MPCVRGRGCTQPEPLPHSGVSFRGTRYWICANHEKDFTDVFKNHKEGSTPQQTEDARKLFIVTSSASLFEICMMALVEETARRHGNAMTWRWKMNHQNFKLSKNLTYYERRCWFGDQPKIFAGLLSSKEFLQAMANGYMVKDPGPGPNHGEFSHRLQWHMLMRVMTADFTVAKTAEWNASPLELFCWTGTTGYWGAALEGLAPADACPGSPNWIDSRLRSDVALSQTSLGQAVNKRRNKRVEMLELIGQKAEEYALEKNFRRNLILCHDGSYPRQTPTYQFKTGRAIQNFAEQNPKLVVLDMLRIAEMLYAWKKTGGPTGYGDGTDHTRAIAVKVWNEEDKAKGSKTGRFHFEDLGGGDFSTGSLLAHSAQCQDGPIGERTRNSKLNLRV